MKLVVPDHTDGEIFSIQFKGTQVFIIKLVICMTLSIENFNLNTIKEELVSLLK